ncbi:hypothetical protein I316_06849 [Kwoniella heveanensis BCC8398]|uniref:Uncharacterized protein n=1 Tax=Kwoniella heveanensis BCC8398 TaxID=1296120 RepID=A0A1B9GKD0_9TREE|nr:hypothetical protein I316_06849 [Kwoniella heveanensis BCC8398]
MPSRWSLRKDNDSMSSMPRSGPAPLTRQAVGIDKLLAVYDEYPQTIQLLENTQVALERAEIDAQAAEDRKHQAEEELKTEKQGRENDRQAAEKAKTAALKKAEEDVRTAKRDTEKKVRDELNPKIVELEKKLKAMTTDRDNNKKELGTLRTQMNGWINGMERLHKERIAGDEKERKAAEERKVLAEKLKVLDEEILAGLRKAQEKPKDEEVTPASKAESVGEKK